MFNEEHGAGDWGTDKLTSKYLKDTPGQEDAIVKSKKVVLKKKAVEEEKPAEPKNKVFHDNKDYAERKAAAKKAKEDRMERMVRARLAGGPPRKNRGAFWRREKSIGEAVVRLDSVGSLLDTKTLMVVPQDRSGKPAENFEDGNHLADVDAGWTKGLKGKDLKAVQDAAKRDRDAKKNIADALNEAAGSDKAEYNKLMDKYGDMPASKVPMKARLRIRELGRSVRGDKGGPTAGDLVKNMKRRRMGEEVEQVVEAKQGSYRQSPEDQKQREKNIQKGIDRMVQLGKDVKAGRKPKMSPARAKLHGEEVEQVDEVSLKKKIQAYTKMAADAQTDDSAWAPEPKKLEKRRAQRMLNKIEKKHGSKAAGHAKRSADFDKEDPKTFTSPREKRQDRQSGDSLARRKPVSMMKGGPRKGKIRPEDAQKRKVEYGKYRRQRNEEVEQVDEVKYGGLLHKVRKGGKPGGLRDLIDRSGRNRGDAVISISDNPKRMTKAQIGRRQRIADRRPSLKGTGPIDDPENYPSHTGFGKTFKDHPNSGAAKLKRALDREDAAVRKRKERPPVKRGGLVDKILKGGKPGSLRDKIDQGHRLRSPETNRNPTGPFAMSKSDIRRAQRMVDRRPSLKGTGPIDDPKNYALKTGGVDMAGIYYDKGDKSGSAKLARQLRKERSQKRSRKQRNEEVEVAEAGMIGRTKPSRELNVQKDEKPHLAGVKSLKYQKRAAHKAERKKGKQDVKINPELDETVERAKRGVDMAKQRVLAAKRKLHRTKARDIGQKMREDTEIEEGGINIAQAGRSADYKSRVGGTQQRYAANRAKRSARATEKHSDVMRRRAIARARSRMRK